MNFKGCKIKTGIATKKKSSFIKIGNVLDQVINLQKQEKKEGVEWK